MDGRGPRLWAAIAEADLTVQEGIPVTTPVKTLLDVSNAQVKYEREHVRSTLARVARRLAA